jgi:hypothetical protein
MSKIFFIHSKMDFGKYKGIGVKELLSSDPEYILWCYMNVEGFEIIGTDVDALRKRVESWHAFDGIIETAWDDDENGNSLGLGSARPIHWDDKPTGVVVTAEDDGLSKCRCGGGMGGCICGEYDLLGGFSGGL